MYISLPYLLQGPLINERNRSDRRKTRADNNHTENNYPPICIFNGSNSELILMEEIKRLNSEIDWDSLERNSQTSSDRDYNSSSERESGSDNANYSNDFEQESSEDSIPEI